MKKPTIRIGTSEEIIWTTVRDNLKQDIEEMEKVLKVKTEFLKVANSKILLEQRK